MPLSPCSLAGSPVAGRFAVGRGAIQRTVMWLRLRQIALVARELAPVVDDLREGFGLEVAVERLGRRLTDDLVLICGVRFRPV